MPERKEKRGCHEREQRFAPSQSGQTKQTKQHSENYPTIKMPVRSDNTDASRDKQTCQRNP
jgi:hypothetical protein